MGFRTESEARGLQGLFKVVESTTSSITATTTRTGVTKPTGTAGKVITAFISGGSVRGSGAAINNITLTDGSVDTIDVWNGITAQTVTVCWVFAGHF